MISKRTFAIGSAAALAAAPVTTTANAAALPLPGGWRMSVDLVASDGTVKGVDMYLKDADLDVTADEFVRQWAKPGIEMLLENAKPGRPGGFKAQLAELERKIVSVGPLDKPQKIRSV